MILTFFSGLWSKVWGYVVAGGVVLTLLLGIYEKGRSDSKASIDTAAAKQNLKNLQEANKIEHSVDKLSDADVDAALAPWMRDK